MEYITNYLDVVLHIDKHLIDIVGSYHYWTYLILFLIIFAETGFVVTPFLPGDSVLFAVGTLIALPDINLNIYIMTTLLVFAAISGDFVNYELGRFLGFRVFNPNSRFFKPIYLEKTQFFYHKHGNKTIIYARFVPIIRTFAPFFAGISKMKYSQFAKYNVLGAILWVCLLVFSGYFLGNIDFVREHFSIVVIFIILISITPPIIQFLKTSRFK